MLASYTMFILFLITLLTCYRNIAGVSTGYDKMVIFGDSNSDNGNVYRMTNFQLPTFPYYQGRFSNGLIWVDRLSFSPIENYAYGGATTDNNIVQGYSSGSIPVPGVRQQIAIYSKTLPTSSIKPNRTLYIIWAGGNNFLLDKNSTLNSIADSIGDCTKDIVALGGKQIILFNQPPLQIIPTLQPLANTLNLEYSTKEYNTHLSSVAWNIQQSSSGTNIDIFDLQSLVSQIYATPRFYRILNTNDACYRKTNGTCSNPNTYMFFDSIHFTERIHQYIAHNFNRFASSNSMKLTTSSLLTLLLLVINGISF